MTFWSSESSRRKDSGWEGNSETLEFEDGPVVVPIEHAGYWHFEITTESMNLPNPVILEPSGD